MDFNQLNIFDARIKAPFSMIIAGPSNCGKTSFVANLLHNSINLISSNLDYIIWCYGQSIPKDVKLKDKDIYYIDGIPDNFDNLIDSNKHGLVIFDDLMDECNNNKSISHFFTKRSHHENVSIIFITQNFFSEGKERRTFTKNAKYLVIFNSPLDQTIAQYLAVKIMPKYKKAFHDIFAYVTKDPYSYLLIDGHQETPKEAMLRSNIFDEVQHIFFPIIKNKYN